MAYGVGIKTVFHKFFREWPNLLSTFHHRKHEGIFLQEWIALVKTAQLLPQCAPEKQRGTGDIVAFQQFPVLPLKLPRQGTLQPPIKVILDVIGIPRMVEQKHTAACDLTPGIFTHERHKRLNGVWEQPVIATHELYPLSASRPYATVEVARDSGVGIRCDNLHAPEKMSVPPYPLPANRESIIRGAVIGDDELYVAVGLARKGVEGLHHIARGIVCDTDYRDERLRNVFGHILVWEEGSGSIPVRNSGGRQLCIRRRAFGMTKIRKMWG